MRLIYIGGYGRSGSTLLEQLLTLSPQVVACGEVARAAKRGPKPNKRCTCGQLTKLCPVWSDIQEPRGADRGNHEELLARLRDRLADHYAVMVDSSKTAWGSASMPFKMQRRLGRDFCLLHIVRDPRGVCWSTMKAPTKRMWMGKVPMHRFFVTLVGWCTANLACEIFRRRHPTQYLRIRYEDLARAPKEIMETLFEAVLPESTRHGATERVENCHQLYGNRSRFQEVSLSEVRDAREWSNDMPRIYRELVLILSWPLSSRYGFR